MWSPVLDVWRNKLDTENKIAENRTVFESIINKYEKVSTNIKDRERRYKFRQILKSYKEQFEKMVPNINTYDEALGLQTWIDMLALT